jgi:uncharacterized damage-inducible protein DinB
MFRHHVWATLQLIDHCNALPGERLQESVPGTYGSVIATLIHLVAADQRYLHRMDGAEAQPLVQERRPATLAELRAAIQAQAIRWEALVDRAPELDVTVRRREEPDIPRAEDLLFLQAIHHGNDHRTQVCVVLGAKSLDAPDLDGWHYWPERSR